jgi:hypothetical protein
MVGSISTKSARAWVEPKDPRPLAVMLPSRLFLWKSIILRIYKIHSDTSFKTLWDGGRYGLLSPLPYTLTMLLMDTFTGVDLSGVKVYSSDLNTQVLAQAEL